MKPEMYVVPENDNFKVDTVEISYHGICKSCMGN
jgi:Fe2+ or Zn2+ uptake regulation protein